MTYNRNLYSAEHITVMILAAGEGKRMLPLTESTPKPLLKVGDASLIEHHLLRLSSLGFKNIVINTAYLGSMIQNTIGDGSQFNLEIKYSDESSNGALETAGGIVKALPLINSDPFLVLNADIWTDFNFTDLLKELPETITSRLVLVDNPAHNPAGDFSINHNQELCLKQENSNFKSVTFSGIALYKKSIFSKLNEGKQPLAPILKSLIKTNQLEHVVYQDTWTDVGTPERLREINLGLAKSMTQTE